MADGAISKVCHLYIARWRPFCNMVASAYSNCFIQIWRSGGHLVIWRLAIFPKFMLGLFFIYIWRGGGYFAIWRPALSPSCRLGLLPPVAILQDGQLQGARPLERYNLTNHHRGTQINILQDSGLYQALRGPYPRKVRLSYGGPAPQMLCPTDPHGGTAVDRHLPRWRTAHSFLPLLTVVPQRPQN
jgi:hypothetical protein